MTTKTQGKKIDETHQGLFGVEGTDDRGLVGDIKEIKQLIQEQNGRYRTLSKKVYYLYGFIACSTGGISAWVSTMGG